MAEERYINSLDGLRGLAATLVVFTHLGSLVPVFRNFDSVGTEKFGQQGVAVFFSLSGFLMAWLYGGRAYTRAAAADYLVSRFSRIYPVYFVAICTSVLLSSIPALNYIEHLTEPKNIFRHVMMLGSDGVFWSIPPEVQFYIFFLLLWLCFSSMAKYHALAIGIAALLAVDAALNFPGPGIFLLSKLPYFLFGAIAGRLHSLMPPQKPAAAVGVAAWVLLLLFVPSRIFHIFTFENFWGMPSALMAALIVYFVACQHSLTARVFESKPLRFLGMVSFSLYLFHAPVLFLVNKIFANILPPLLLIPFALMAAVIFAWLSYSTIEVPVRRMLVSRWKLRRREIAPKISAEAA